MGEALAAPDLIYLGRSRLERSRANLIQTLSTIDALESLGVRVRLWLPRWRGSGFLAEKLEEIGIDRRLDVRGSRLLHPRWGFWPFVAWRKRELAAAPALYTRVPEVSVALGRAGLRHHLEVHDVEGLLAGPAGGAVIALHRAGLIGALLPISGAAGRRLLEAGAAEARVHVAPSGVRLEAYEALPTFDPARLDRPRVVHLGRLTAERGSAILRAVAAAGICEVTVVGGEEALPGVRNIPLVPLREVPGWYGQSDLTLIPYQPSIGTVATMSPLKLFEALAAGRPIVASDLPTIREVLTHEETALLVEPQDERGWIAAVERLRHDRALAAKLAAGARALASRYSWRARAQGILRAIGLPAGATCGGGA